MKIPSPFFGAAALLAISLLFSVGVAGALTPPPPTVLNPNSQGVAPIEIANSSCTVSSSPTTCQGSYTPTQTFRASLKNGEVVTVTVSYLYSNSESVDFTYSDSLGNSISVVSSQCAVSTPIVCTAIGYFRVTSPGYDDVIVTESGGSAGVMWYNAEIWQGQIGKSLSAVGTSSFCAQSCTGQVQLGPLSPGTVKGAIASSAYTAFYSNTPATWQFSYPYYIYGSDQGGPGDSVMWQGTGTPMQSYTYSATTSPTPNVWAGSAELISWT
jgi:hypothetical protein